MDDLEPVVAFLNTVDVEGGIDDLADPAATAGWLGEHGLLPDGARLDARGHERTRALRDVLRGLARVHHDQVPDAAVAVAFDDVARSIPLAATAGEGGDVRVAPAGTGVDAALGRLVAAVTHASAVGTWERVKLCSAETCAWAFVDASKNRSRRWCAMGVCGNRQKARSYRERQRAT